jgi:hypothetical protein
MRMNPHRWLKATPRSHNPYWKKWARQTHMSTPGAVNLSRSASRYLDDVQNLVEQHVQDLHWQGEYADCLCPLGHQARVYINQTFPHLHCFHASCEADVLAVNARLREASAWLGDTALKFEQTPEEKAAQKLKKHLRRLERNAKEFLLPKFRKEPVLVEEWQTSSPFGFSADPIEDHWMLFLGGLFNKEDLVWVGELRESGPNFKRSFRGPSEWIAEEQSAPGQYVGVWTFKHTWSDGSRCKRNAERRVLQILESDSENCETHGRVIKWAQKYMRLRSLVDTGGKSLHAGFEPLEVEHRDFPRKPDREIYQKHPSGTHGYYIDVSENANYQQELDEWNARHGKKWRVYQQQFERIERRRLELNAILVGLGCDKNMLTSNLTTRLPGHIRLDEEGRETERWQRLLYLDPIYEII